MTENDFDSYWFPFHGKCAICEIRMTVPENKRGQKMSCVSIDHDHITGRIRGLLCRKCNNGIGFFGDDKKLLLKAIKYLSYGK